MLLKDGLPPMQSLVVFEAAARHLSFTAAARELCSTQPAVSQLMRALEQTLGLILFNRVYRGVTLTPAGEVLYTTTQQGLQQIASCIKNLQHNEQKPRINVATDFAFAAYWLLPRLPDFQRRFPQVDVRIVTSQGPIGQRDSDIDVYIHFAKQAPNSAVSLFAERVFPVCSPQLLSGMAPIKSHKALAALPLLKLGADAGSGWMDWRQLFEARRSQVVPSESVLTFNNYTLLIQAAIAGQGMALGWGHLVDDLVQSGVLVALESFSASSSGGYFMQAPASAEQPLISDFSEWLTQAAAI